MSFPVTTAVRLRTKSLVTKDTALVPIAVRRNLDERINIAVVSVVDRWIDLVDNVRIAYDSLKCYCDYHGYPLHLLSLDKNETLRALCPQADIMFQRHCVIARLLSENPTTIDWLLFVDADFGVINPNHLIEEYISPSFHLILYERTHSDEIAACSYLARNDQYTITLLRDWANYIYRVPNSHHGRDNGALPSLLMDKLCGNCSSFRSICQDMWKTSKDYHDIHKWTACARYVLGLRNNFDGKVLLRTGWVNGGYWARDGWLTRTKWSASDFMFHGWKTEKLGREWITPFALEKFDLRKCTTSDAYENWLYNRTLMAADREVHAQMETHFKVTFKKQLDRLHSVVENRFAIKRF